MARNSGIIAYGTADDRLRLAAISKVLGHSRSEVVVHLIRERYEQLFGDLSPQLTGPDDGTDS